MIPFSLLYFSLFCFVLFCFVSERVGNAGRGTAVSVVCLEAELGGAALEQSTLLLRQELTGQTALTCPKAVPRCLRRSAGAAASRQVRWGWLA